MMRVALLAFAACALAGCEDPRGSTDQFLAAAKAMEKKDFEAPPPLPMLRPRPVEAPAIARDPFRR